MFWIILVAVLLAGLASSNHTNAAKHSPPGQRKALVIGNSQYMFVDKLPGAANDSSDVGQAMKKLGFETQIVKDATLVQLKAAFDDLIRTSNQSDTIFIFYSGHGFQEGTANYLAPIDLYQDPTSHKFVNKLNLSELLPRLVSVSRVRIFFLDACRNDPYSPSQQIVKSKGFANKGPGRRAAASNRTVVTRVIKTRALIGYANGFGRMNTTDPGTFVAYSTASGQVALDRLAGSRNSPFTTSLLKYIGQPDLEVSNLITKVRREVYQATSNLTGRQGMHQLPWSESSLVNPFFFVDRTHKEWIAKRLQTTLKGVQCYSGRVDGKWGAGSRLALARFNTTNGSSYLTETPTLAALDALGRSIGKAKKCPAAAVPSARRNSASSRNGSRRVQSSKKSNRGIRDCGGLPCSSTATYPSGKKIIITTHPESPF